MTHPAQPQTGADPAGVNPAAQTISIPVPPAPPQQPAAPAVATLSPEQIAELQRNAAALQERLEQEAQARAALEQRMAAFDTDLQTRQQAEQEAREAAERAAEEKRQAELSYAERLQEYQQQTTAQVQSLQEQLAQRDAVLERERQFNELMQYRSQLLQQHGDDIVPELHDLVAGNTREELEQSVSALKERSASILQNVAQAAQQVRQNARGVGVTAPPVGPMDNQSGHETYSAADIAAMDMSQYAAIRGRLLGAASNAQRDRGMFG